MGKDWNYSTTDNHLIRITTYGNNNLLSNKSLIFVHGFKGFKDWGFVPFLGNYFADKGFFVITFNFSHNGVGKSLTEFDELEKFAKNTFSREVKELSEVIDIYRNNFFGEVKNPRIGLIGHSRGGAVALLAAYQKLEVNAVTTWSSVSKLDRYSERQKEEWKKQGYFEVMNARTKQMMRLNVALLEDIETNKKESLNIQDSVGNLNKPLLIAHGEQDLAVPFKEAEQLYEWSDKTQTEFLKIMKTGHTFDIKHPFEGLNEKFERVLDATNRFFKYKLN